MDRSVNELSKYTRTKSFPSLTPTSITRRAELHDLRGKPAVKSIQRKNTFNILHLHTGHGAEKSINTIVPPVLHIKLGIINKIVHALYGVVKEWETVVNWEKTEIEPLSAARNHLSRTLSQIGARRENYYSGALSGVPCNIIMSKMHIFCDSFFYKLADSWGRAVDVVPSPVQLSKNLKEVSNIYMHGSISDYYGSNSMGLCFFLSTQKRWTE